MIPAKMSEAPTRPWHIRDTSIYGANDQLVATVGVFTTTGDSITIAAAPTLLESARLVLKGFGDAVFVRNIEDDDKPGWAIHALPYINALAHLEAAVRQVDADGK